MTRQAQADMDDIWTFIARDNITDANKFIQRLESQLKTLGVFPSVVR